MLTFFQQLAERALAVESLLCVGLDPHPELLPQPTAAAARAFCLRLIEGTAEHSCAFKPNSAFFERYGDAGWAALRAVIAAIPPEIPVILDVKRGDIASTARAYAAAAFEGLGAGAVTLNPYLGYDAIEPFLAYAGRGVFLLCKTSNPSADEIQRLGTADGPLFLQVARLAQGWAGPERLGMVVGATDVRALAEVRQQASEMWLLAPGLGPQGAQLEPALRAGLRRDGLGLLLPVSRAIADAADARAEAGSLRLAINAVREALTAGAGGGGAAGADSAFRPSTSEVLARRAGGAGASRQPSGRVGRQPPLDGELAQLADALLEAGCVRFGEFTLKDGSHSPIYFDLRLLTGRPGLLGRAAAAYLPLLGDLAYDRLAAVPYAGLPIGTALALRTGKPLVYPRKERKQYGTGAAVEGGFLPGETVLLIDDLATSGASKLEAMETLTHAGLRVTDVAVLIDRQGGAREQLAQGGCQLRAVFTLSQLLDHWQRSGGVPRTSIEAVRSFLVEQA